MSMQDLMAKIKAAVDYRVSQEARIMRGTIHNGKLNVGSKQYAMTQAVDCNVSDGRRVWALRTSNGKAVIVGA